MAREEKIPSSELAKIPPVLEKEKPSNKTGH